MNHFLILWHDFCPRLQFPLLFNGDRAPYFWRGKRWRILLLLCRYLGWRNGSRVGASHLFLASKSWHNAIEFLMSVHNKRAFLILARPPPKTSCGNVSDCNQPPSGNLKKESNISPFFGLSLILWAWVQAAIFFSCRIFIWFVYVIKNRFP